VELKLILPGNQVEELVVDCLRKNKYVVVKINPVTNVDIYLDTSDWTLAKNKLSLRYRLANDEAFYTMKSVGTIENGVAKRSETEVRVEKPVRDPARIPVDQIREQINSIIYPRKLMEQVLIRTYRRRYLADSPEGAKFELSFDTSNFSADPIFKPHRAENLHEFEAEVASGPVIAVESLASILSKTFGYAPSTGSKLQSAIARLGIEPIVKKVPENLKVRLDDRLDVALIKILTVEFLWLQEQFPGTIADSDPEFVHQARVATRRMRSVLALFPDALQVDTVTFFKENLKWLGGLFGKVRDLDVFTINLTSYKDKIEDFPDTKRNSLEKLVMKQRRVPLNALTEALKSDRCKAFEGRMREFLGEPYKDCPELPMGMKTIKDIAQHAITEKFEIVAAQGKKTLADPKLTKFHCLRIFMKRLRYALEFLAPPFGGAFDDIIRRTVGIQDNLGQLQDTVFTKKLIRKLVKESKGKPVNPSLVFILGEIYQYQDEIARGCQKTFTEKWENFSPEKTRVILRRVFEGPPVKNKG
jgi:CHAD domain-containing protein